MFLFSIIYRFYGTREKPEFFFELNFKSEPKKTVCIGPFQLVGPCGLEKLARAN